MLLLAPSTRHHSPKGTVMGGSAVGLGRHKQAGGKGHSEGESVT